MHFHTLGVAVLTLALNIVKCQNKVDPEDENRPYEFGFNIEGYQHRHEKKDEKGIIMGEFGFITGDGVYHITVYATDEDGNFKILKMKNIYIGLPMENSSIPTPGIAEMKPMKVSEIITNQIEEKKPEGVAGCGGCVVPVKPESEGANKSPPPIGMQQPTAPAKPMVAPEKPMKPTLSMMLGGHMEINKKPPMDKPALKPEAVSPTPKPTEGSTIGKPGKETPMMNALDVPGKEHKPMITQEGLMEMIQSLTHQGNPNKDKPPSGMTFDDLMGLLYKYNYTLSYHGHHETGNQKGEKSGGYFANGRDGVGVDVKYTANEFGYQPNITFRNLKDEETPKEDTEKLLNKLHGYEFKWFYSK